MALTRRGFLVTAVAFFAVGCGRIRKRDIVDSRTRVGRLEEDDAPAYIPEARAYLVRYPASALDEARKVYPREVFVGLELGLAALYQKCTHLGCRVPFCETSQWFECPCHASLFNKAGEVMGGPAPRGLDHFVLEVEDGEVFIVGDPITGAPQGTNTTKQDPEGPHCIGPATTAP
ncbi:MAG: ubiquinol-cytochrome c reductase iron-sulfur subunit [Actinomycetota bacterium]